MSELTQCNYCSLQRIKARAKATKQKVTILRDSKWGMGGMNIYMSPRNIEISALPGGEDGERAVYSQAWFMSISKSCCC